MKEQRINDQYIPVDVLVKRKGYSIITFMEVIRKFSRIPLIKIDNQYYIPIIYADDAVKIYECVYFGKCD